MSNSAMIDQKGRLKFPATLLPALKVFSAEFFITSVDGSSSASTRGWSGTKSRTDWSTCAHNENNQKLLVRAKYFGEAVAMNNQGRVLIRSFCGAVRT